MVAVTFGLVLFENFFRKIQAEPISSQTDEKGRVIIAGQYLAGAKFSLMSVDNTHVLIDSLETRAPEESQERIRAVSDHIQRLQAIPFSQREYRQVTLDVNNETYGKGQKVHFRVQRAHFIPILGALMPYFNCRTEVTVGAKPAPPVEPPTPSVVELRNAHYRPDATIALEGTALGKSGQVLLTGSNITPEIKDWTENQITFTLPKTTPPGAYYVNVTVANKNYPAGQIVIDAVVGMNAPDPTLPGTAGLPGGPGTASPGGNTPGGPTPPTGGRPPTTPGTPGQNPPSRVPFPGNPGQPTRPFRPGFHPGDKPSSFGSGRESGSVYQGGDRPGLNQATHETREELAARASQLDPMLTAQTAAGDDALALATRAYLALDRAATRVLKGLPPAELRRDVDFIAGERLTDQALGLNLSGRAAAIAYTANGVRLGLKKIEIVSGIHNRDWQNALDSAMRADRSFLPARYWRWGFERYIANETTLAQTYIEQALTELPGARRSQIMAQWNRDFRHL